MRNIVHRSPLSEQIKMHERKIALHKASLQFLNPSNKDDMTQCLEIVKGMNASKFAISIFNEQMERGYYN